MLIWYGAGAVAAMVIAWLAALVHASGHAPVGLISLVVGAALGAILAKIAASQRIAGRKRLILGTVMLAILAVLAEHAWLYLDFRRQCTRRERSRRRSPCFDPSRRGLLASISPMKRRPNAPRFGVSTPR